MNLKRVFLCIFAAVLLGGGLFLSCSNIFEDGGDGESSTAALIVNLPESARSLYSQGDAASFRVSISPEAAKSVTVEGGAGKSAAFRGIPAGKYTVHVHGLDESGLRVAKGSAQVSVRGGMQSDVTVAVHRCVKEIETWEELVRAAADAESGYDVLVVEGDLTATSTLAVSSDLTIRSKGDLTATARRAEGFSGPFVQVAKGASLTLGGGSGLVTFDGSGGESDSAFLVDGSMTMLSGAKIANNRRPVAQEHKGGGVSVKGSMTLSGGSITNNYGGYKGGGIYVDNGGSLTITSGEITENSASRGAGIFTQGSTTLVDGKISRNYTVDGVDTKSDGTTTNPNGGGILAMWPATFTMTGGEISENYAGKNGGGILVGKSSSNGCSTATITGGSISNNHAGYTSDGAESSEKGKGGGIYADGNLILGGTVSIYGNESSKSGTTLFISDSPEIAKFNGRNLKRKNSIDYDIKDGAFTGSIDERAVYSYSAANWDFSTQPMGLSDRDRTDDSYSAELSPISGSGATLLVNGSVQWQKNDDILFLHDTTAHYDSPASSFRRYLTLTLDEDADFGIVYKGGGDATKERFIAIFDADGNKIQGETGLYSSQGKRRIDIKNLPAGTYKIAPNGTEVFALAVGGDNELSKLDYLVASSSGSSSSQNTEGGGTNSSYTRDSTEWSESDFRNALNSANLSTDSTTTTTVTLQGNVTITSDLTVENYITIDGQGRFGITIQAENATFKNVTFKNGAGTHLNGSEKQAHGMVYWGGSGTLAFDSCTFDGNVTEGDTGGGAASLFGSGKVEFSGCTFNGNSANHGAAIDIGGSDEVKIDTCVFNANTSKDNHDIYCGGSAAKVSGSGNTSDKQNPYACTDQNADSATKSWSGFTTNP